MVKEPDQFGTLGYGGNAIVPIDADTIAFSCGNAVKMLHPSNGTHSVIWGHNRSVDVIAYNPKKKLLAYSDKKMKPDVTILRLDSKTAKPCILKDGTEVEYVDMCFSRDGSLLVTLGALPDYSVVVWNCETGAQIVKTSVASSPGSFVTFNPRNANEICVSGRGNVVFLRMEKQLSGTVLLSTEGNTNSPSNKAHCHAWTPKGDVLVGTSEGEIWKFDSTTAEGDCIVEAPPQGPTEKAAASGSGASKLEKRNVQINQILITKTHFVTASEDGAVRFYLHSTTNINKTSNVGGPFGAKKIAFNEKFDRLFVGSGDGRIVSLTLDGYTDPNKAEDALFPKGEIPSVLLSDNHAGAITGVAHTGGPKKNLVTCGEDGTVRFWDYLTNKIVMKQVYGPNTKFTCLSCNPEGGTVAVGSSKGVLRIIGADNPAFIRPVYRERLSVKPISEVRTSAGNKYVAALTQDQCIFIIDSSRKAEVLGFVRLPSGNTVLDMQWSKDGSQLLVSNDVAEVLLLEPPKSKPANETLEMEKDAILKHTWKIDFNATAIAAMDDDFRLFAISQNRKVVMYRLVNPTSPDPSRSDPLYVHFPEQEADAHEKVAAGGTIVLSPDGKLLLTAASDGVVTLRETADIRVGHVLKRHDPFLGGAKRACFSSDSALFFTAGSDGVLFQYNIKAVAVKGNFSVAKTDNVKDEDQESEGTYVQKAKQEKEQQDARKHQTFKDKMKKDVARIRQQLQVLLEVNQDKPELEQLQRHEFLIDTEFGDILRAEGEKRAAAIKDELKFENLSKLLLAHRIKKDCWDSMSEHQTVLKGFASPVQVRNYPIRKHASHGDSNSNNNGILEKVKFLREMDEREKRRRKERSVVDGILDAPPTTSLEDGNNNETTTQLSSSAAGAAEQSSNALTAAAGAAASPTVAAGAAAGVTSPVPPSESPNVAESLDLDETASPTSAGPLSPSPNPSAQPQQQATNSASTATLMAHPSQQDDEEENTDQYTQLYSPVEVYTRTRKITQIHLLKGAVHDTKMKFNGDFKALLERKRQDISKIEEKNNRLTAILAELNTTEELFKPRLENSEIPETILSVKDSEVTVEKFISPEERKRLEEQARLEEERRARERGDDSGERALKMMMDGKLQSRQGKDAEKAIVRPESLNKPVESMSDEERKLLKEWENKEAKYRDEQEKLKKQLDAERKKIQQEIGDIVKAFDDTVAAMLNTKLETDQLIYEHELRLIKLAQAVLQEEEIQAKEEAMQREQDELKIKKIKSSAGLTEFKKEVDLFKEKMELLDAEKKQLVQSFRAKFTDAEEHADLLNRLFLKKTKPKGGVSESISFSDNPDPFADFETKLAAAAAPSTDAAGSSGLLEDPHVDRPDGIPDHVWERMMELRLARLESEAELARRRSTLSDMTVQLALLERQDAEMQSHMQSLIKELADFRETRQREAFNVDMLFKFKQGQVEVEQAAVVTDYADAIMIDKQAIKDLNEVILVHGKDKVNILKETKEFNKELHITNWEIERLQFEKEDLRFLTEDIQLMHVTKAMQEFIKNGSKNNQEAERANIARKIEYCQKNLETKIGDKKRVLKTLRKNTDEKLRENTALERKIVELEIMVAERQDIYNTQSTSKDKAQMNQRLKDLRYGRKLQDLSKAQADEIKALRDELDKLRERTFPSFAVIQRRHLGNVDQR